MDFFEDTTLGLLNHNVRNHVGGLFGYRNSNEGASEEITERCKKKVY